jgi:hypothetical protein
MGRIPTPHEELTRRAIAYVDRRGGALIRRGGRGGGGMGGSRVDSIVAGLTPRHWYRADTVTLAGANLATMPNRGTAGGQLNVTAGVLAAPTADATLGGAPSVRLTGTQWLDSDLPASEFLFLHDGTGNDVFVVYVPTAAAGSFLMATASAASNTLAGVTYQIAASQGMRVYCGNGSALLYDSTEIGGSFPLGQAGLLEHSYLEGGAPEIFSANASAVHRAFATSLGPNAGDPSTGFRLGSVGSGAIPARAHIAEVVMFDKRLPPYERQQVREYIEARYGIPAPVWSAEDREILQLNPFSWIRSDYYASVNSKVSAFLDKVLPGHSMVQGTVANQVANPAADAAIGGKLSAPFVGAQFYDSSLPSTAWVFEHNGSGFENHAIWVPTATTTGSLFSTDNINGGSGVGLSMGANAAAPLLTALVRNASSTFIINTAPPAPGLAVGTLAHYSLSYVDGAAPEYEMRFRDTLVGSGADTGAPSSGPPSATLRIGANVISVVQQLNGRVADMLSFKRRLSDVERATVYAYRVSRYEQ